MVCSLHCCSLSICNEVLWDKCLSMGIFISENLQSFMLNLRLFCPKLEVEQSTEFSATNLCILTHKFGVFVASMLTFTANICPIQEITVYLNFRFLCPKWKWGYNSLSVQVEWSLLNISWFASNVDWRGVDTFLQINMKGLYYTKHIVKIPYVWMYGIMWNSHILEVNHTNLIEREYIFSYIHYKM